MSQTINSPIYGSSSSQRIYFEPVNICPMCKHSISPTILTHKFYARSINLVYFSVLNRCEACGKSFITRYKGCSSDYDSRSSAYSVSLDCVAPNQFTPQIFDDSISSLSPQFVKIYNQAYSAECSDLDEIAGLGYRKSLEFLIKDFCIQEYPDEMEAIKKSPLSQCITKWIKNPQIQTLAQKSAWIGNDEAHYVRKQEDRDVKDMKKFINAIIHFISMILITKDAETMVAK